MEEKHGEKFLQSYKIEIEQRIMDLLIKELQKPYLKEMFNDGINFKFAMRQVLMGMSDNIN